MEKTNQAVEKSLEASEVQTPSSKCALGIRHLQGFILFGGLLFAYIVRMNLSVAIVQMATSTENKLAMSSTEKAMMLSAMFWGYGLLQIPLGSLGRKGHSVRILALSNLLSGIFSLATPWAATAYGPTGVCVTRIATGLVQGGIYPNTYNLMSKWVIPQEKEALTSLLFTGPILGSLISMTLSGYLGYHFDWPSIFYVTGLMVVIYGILQGLTGSESPETCKYISSEERDFMEISVRLHKGEAGEKRTVPSSVPWKKIMTSVPVLATLVTMWCGSWGVWTIATLTPSYINGVLNYNLEENGLLSALPNLSAFIVGLSLSYVASLVKRKSGLSDSFLRPMWNSFGQYGSCLGLICLAYLPVDAGLAVGLLVFSVSVNILSNLGHNISHFDLSPNFAGVIMSITNSVANTASIVGPLLSTYLITDNSDREQWRIVFLMAATIFFIGATVFLFWGSTKRQPWDDEEERQQGDA